MFTAIVLCAGKSARMNMDFNKVLLPLLDMPIFMHSVNKFKELTDDVIVVSNSSDYQIIKNYHDNVVLGGATRQESVYNGVINAKYDKILIHDGARPFISSNDIKKLLELDNCDCAFLGLEMINSIKDKATFKNLNRDNYVMSLTPQMVKKELYLKAFSLTNETYTDDVSLLEGVLNIKPQMVVGLADNIKITTYEDYLKAISSTEKIRVGHSWDVHKLVENRKLILGGIEIPHNKGLLGHSDADALLHAIAESLLGALALGDLGTHFPDNDPKYKGIDSKVLLKNAYQLIINKGYRILNIDTMIYAEEPKMKPYINLMREVISKVLEINIDQISIKATTYEKMDAIGRGEAIACDSTCLVIRVNEA